MSSSEKRPLAAYVLGALGGACAIAIALTFARAQPRTFPLDDAYIHLAYGKSLARSGVLGLNPGEPSLGTSSPLWSLLLAPLFWIFGDPYWSVHALSLLSVAGYIVLATSFLWSALAWLRLPAVEVRAATALGAILLAANGSLLWMSLSGMETSLVVFVCAATIASYGRFGPGVRTGLLMGLCLLGRSTTVALVAALALVELAGPRRYRRALVTLGCAAGVYAPYAFYAWRVSGSFIPNTAKGKLLTYVRGGFDLDDWLHYWGRAVAFNKYLIAYPILGACILFAGWTAWKNARRSGTAGMREASLRLPAPLVPLVVLGVWALIHVAEYTIAFRTIGQQGRYLAEWLFAVAIVGAFAVAYCARLLPSRVSRLAFFATIALAHVATLPYWLRVYRHNLAHVEDTYVKMSEFIRDNTPTDARIATFDIGTVRYVGERYTIDLGGLVDTSTHDCLRERNCGEYVHDRRAGYVMYPKDPEADKLTGVQQATFGPRYALREVFVKQFDTPDYAAPTLTHSFRLQLFRVDGWYERSRVDQDIEAVREEPPNADLPMVPTSWSVEPDFAIVGYRMDTMSFRYVREYPYTATLWLEYKALQPLHHPKWLHILLYDDEVHRAITCYDSLATEGVLVPSTWPVGKVVEEHRVFDIPWDQRSSKYHLLVSVNEERFLDLRYPELYAWLDLGTMSVKRSATTALAPL